MSPSFWSDQDRLFVPRLAGLSINFKFIARKLGLIKRKPQDVKSEVSAPSVEGPESAHDRMKQAVDRSKFEQQ
jgi:hypothetical protein